MKVELCKCVCKKLYFYFLLSKTMQADMKSKDTFILRKKYQNQISKLSIDEKAELLDKMFSYQTTWEFTDNFWVVDMLLSIMIDERKQDDEKYLGVCEKNRENGKLWWRPAKNRKNPTVSEKPKKADKWYMINDSDIKEKEEDKSSSKKKDEFETFWKEFPHARKWKKADSYNYFLKQDSDEVMKQVRILKRKIRAWLQDWKYIPACERWIRDFTPLNDDVIKQDLVKICKRHMNEWGDMKERSLELKQTFWEQQINEIAKQIQQKPSLSFN